jgi:hypothetical protein
MVTSEERTMATKRIVIAVMTLSVLLTARVAVSAGLQNGKIEQKSAPNVTGRWSMSVKGSPHGDVTMGLELTQDRKRSAVRSPLRTVTTFR